MERLERHQKIKEPTVAKGLKENYDIFLPNPGVSEEEPGERKFSEGYREEIMEAIETSFFRSRSEGSALKRPLNNGDSWMKGGNGFDLESSESSESSDGKEEPEEVPDFAEEGEATVSETRTQEDKADTIMEIIRNLEEDFPEGVPMDSVRYSASEVGIDEDFVNEFVRKQKEEGALLQPFRGKSPNGGEVDEKQGRMGSGRSTGEAPQKICPRR